MSFDSVTALRDKWEPGPSPAKLLRDLRAEFKRATTDEERVAIVEEGSRIVEEWDYGPETLDSVMNLHTLAPGKPLPIFDREGREIPDDHPARVALRQALARPESPEERASLFQAASDGWLQHEVDKTTNPDDPHSSQPPDLSFLEALFREALPYVDTEEWAQAQTGLDPGEADEGPERLQGGRPGVTVTALDEGDGPLNGATAFLQQKLAGRGT